jgi:hypothetical protein
MGLFGARLYISKEWSVTDIADVLQRRLETKVKIEFHDWALDYITLNLEYMGATLFFHVHSDVHVAGLSARLISTHAGYEGILVLKKLADTFGGLYQESDTTEEFEAIPKPGEGNIDFVVRQAIKHNPELGSNDEAMAAYIKEEQWRAGFEWHKPSRGGK